MASQGTATTSFTRDERLAFCAAVANLIAADRKISNEERAHLADLIQEAGLSPNDPDVQKAVYTQLSAPAPIEKVVASIKNPALRRQLFRALIEVAVSDGLAPQEEERLTKLAQVFELNPKAARELIQWTVEHIALEKREDEILKRL